ncbi:MAG: MoxR family ATPase [Thermoguttaceae bacterium]|jgi:MoxR-like ATPase
MSTVRANEQVLAGFHDDFDALRREVAKIVVGQPQVIDGVLVAAVAGGHVLVEGVPGVGKTVLVETLSDVLQLTSNRIQFTPDLMPSDLLGTYVVMESAQGRRTFEFQQGPIFANLIQADHINRGTPKTQSALLQAMEGEVIAMGHEEFHLPQPFFVMATQNPLEMEGTFPLPEPELDRFFFKLLAPRPTGAEIEAVLDRTTEGLPPETRALIDGKRLLEMRDIARTVMLNPALRHWVVGLVTATHPDGESAPEPIRRYVRYGAGVRAAQAMVLGAKILAAADGRSEVAREDLARLVLPALRHRVQLNFEGQAENVSPDGLVESVVAAVK